MVLSSDGYPWADQKVEEALNLISCRLHNRTMAWISRTLPGISTAAPLGV
jgi:hypothetical protein